MLDLRCSRQHLDLNVVAQPREVVHQFALGQIADVAAQHVGNFGLRETGSDLSGRVMQAPSQALLALPPK